MKFRHTIINAMEVVDMEAVQAICTPEEKPKIEIGNFLDEGLKGAEESCAEWGIIGENGNWARR